MLDPSDVDLSPEADKLQLCVQLSSVVCWLLVACGTTCASLTDHRTETGMQLPTRTTEVQQPTGPGAEKVPQLCFVSAVATDCGFKLSQRRLLLYLGPLISTGHNANQLCGSKGGVARLAVVKSHVPVG